MKTALVGYTGFVGSNLYEKGTFDYKFNSKNIEEAYGLTPDLLIYAGIRAEKYLANLNPTEDLNNIKRGMENIKKIRPKKLVLISTIDVYPVPINVNEDSVIDSSVLQPYGANRFYLEQVVRENFSEALIIRLPGLFGKNIKKNFIYDFINRIPTMIKEEKFQELVEQQPELYTFYEKKDDHFWKCRSLTKKEKEILRIYLARTNFSSLSFTDSRSIFQFYNLSHLWEHILVALNSGLTVLNLATEPIGINELYSRLTNESFINEVNSTFPRYDFRTKYDFLFGGKNGYIYDKETILQEITTFVNGNNF